MTLSELQAGEAADVMYQSFSLLPAAGSDISSLLDFNFQLVCGGLCGFHLKGGRGSIVRETAQNSNKWTALHETSMPK